MMYVSISEILHVSYYFSNLTNKYWINNEFIILKYIWNECDPFICYSGIFSSIIEIFRENGILGFFSGIVPRILGEIASTVIASSLTFIVNSYLVNDNDLKKFTAASMTVSTRFYQVVKESETFTVRYNADSTHY